MARKGIRLADGAHRIGISRYAREYLRFSFVVVLERDASRQTVSVRFVREEIRVAQICAKAEMRPVVYFGNLGQLIPPCIRQVGKTGKSGRISDAKIARKRG